MERDSLKQDKSAVLELKSQNLTLDESPPQTKIKDQALGGSNTVAKITREAAEKEKAASEPNAPEQLIEARAQQTKKSDTIDLKVEKADARGNLPADKTEAAAPG